MKKIFFLSLLLLMGSAVFAQSPSIVGRWKTVDKGNPKSIVKITKEGNTYVGEVVQLFNKPADTTCEKCTGQMKGKPVVGMKILYGMVDDGPNKFAKGQIIDPESGKIYYCKATIDASGKELKVRGSLDSVGLAGRTQVWERISE